MTASWRRRRASVAVYGRRRADAREDDQEERRDRDRPSGEEGRSPAALGGGEHEQAEHQHRERCAGVRPEETGVGECGRGDRPAGRTPRREEQQHDDEHVGGRERAQERGHATPERVSPRPCRRSSSREDRRGTCSRGRAARRTSRARRSRATTAAGRGRRRRAPTRRACPSAASTIPMRRHCGAESTSSRPRKYAPTGSRWWRRA